MDSERECNSTKNFEKKQTCFISLNLGSHCRLTNIFNKYKSFNISLHSCINARYCFMQLSPLLDLMTPNYQYNRINLGH